MVKTDSRQHEVSTKKVVIGHVLNWALMILMTIGAFIAVGMQLMPPVALIAFILFLAFIQVLLQLILFMHLKHERIWPSVFMLYGGVVAVVFALGLWWMA